MTRGRAWARAALVTAIVLGVDQVSKALVRGGIDAGQDDAILPGVKIVNVRNDGVAFGIDAGGQTLVVVLIGVALLGLLGYFVRHADRPGMWLPTGLLLGGALGNIADRIRDGAVTDFIKVPLWPAFNLADVAIVGGVVALLYVLEKPRRGAPSPA